MSHVPRPCIDGGRHEWDNPRSYWADKSQDVCLRCCGSRRTEVTDCFYAGFLGCFGTVRPGERISGVRSCDFCEVSYLRRLAKVEQAPVMAALKAEEEEVVSLYPALQNVWDVKRSGTPQWWKERYPEWQAARKARQETARQRALLRQGHRTMTAIRMAVRHGAVRSQPAESQPARTSPTS